MKEHPGSWYRGFAHRHRPVVLVGVDWRRRPGRSQDPLSESRQLH
jgi:hypothetical protein